MRSIKDFLLYCASKSLGRELIQHEHYTIDNTRVWGLFFTLEEANALEHRRTMKSAWLLCHVTHQGFHTLIEISKLTKLEREFCKFSVEYIWDLITSFDIYRLLCYFCMDLKGHNIPVARRLLFFMCFVCTEWLPTCNNGCIKNKYLLMFASSAPEVLCLLRNKTKCKNISALSMSSEER